MRLTAEQMRSLPCFFSQIPDPRPDPRAATSFVDGLGDLAAGALLTQRELATYLVEKRKVHYYFTVKGTNPVF